MEKKKKIFLYFLTGIFLLLILFLGFLKIKEKFLKSGVVYIYLSLYKNNTPWLIPVERKISYYGDIEEKIKAVVEELIKGPTEEEKENGFSTCVPENVKILDVRVNKKEKIVYLDFSKEIEQGGGTLLMEARIAQIVYTATQFPEIESVRFLIEGKTIDYFSGEGITIVEHPIKREDLKEFEINVKEVKE